MVLVLNLLLLIILIIFFDERSVNGTVYYNSKIFDKELLNIIFGDWEKIDIKEDNLLF